MVMELRAKSGAPMMECKKALEDAGSDIEKANRFLRERGLNRSVKMAGRKAGEGLVATYVHTGGKVGAIVEINCETDFVARTEEYQSLVRDLAIHTVASNPKYVDRQEVPAAEIEEEKKILLAEAKNSGRPEAVLGKIVDGRIEKYYKEVCLLEQPFVREPDVTVKELIQRFSAKVGENVQVRRFVRFQLGEEA